MPVSASVATRGMAIPPGYHMHAHTHVHAHAHVHAESVIVDIRTGVGVCR